MCDIPGKSVDLKQRYRRKVQFSPSTLHLILEWSLWKFHYLWPRNAACDVWHFWKVFWKEAKIQKKRYFVH